MIKGLAGLPQSGGNKIENFWAWKSAEVKKKMICKITNSATKRNRIIVLVCFS